MPQSMTDFLLANKSIISKLEHEAQHEGHEHQPQLHPAQENGIAEGGADDGVVGDEEAAIASGEILRRPTVRLEEFWDAFHEIAKAAGGEWGRRMNRVWAFGPNRVGPNLLLDCRPEGERWCVPATTQGSREKF